MSGEHRYLSLEDVLDLVSAASVGPVRDLGLLDSAVARPRSSLLGQDAYRTLSAKAAALLHSIVSNHALVDGNKRLGWFATDVFLRINGYGPDLEDDEAVDLVMSVAAGEYDVHEIARRLRLRPVF